MGAVNTYTLPKEKTTKSTETYDKRGPMRIATIAAYCGSWTTPRWGTGIPDS